MKKALPFIILSVILLFLACKREEPAVARFWPLTTGNSWTSEEQYSWDVGGVYKGSSQSTSNYTVEDTVEREDGVLLWPVVVDTAGVIISRTYYQVTEDSVYLYESEKEDAEPTAVEPNNLEVGMEWYGNLALPITIPEVQSLKFNFPAHFKIVGDTSITVPAGTFDALVIRIDLINNADTVTSAATQWRAEGVGLVKLVADFTTTVSVPPFNFETVIYGISELTSTNF